MTHFAVQSKLRPGHGRLLALLWALLTLPTVHAAELESPERIEAAAIKAYEQQMGQARGSVDASLPDQRLRLPRCETPLDAQLRGGGSRAQALVSCPGRWKLYVPVRATLERQVMVTQRSLRGGEVLGPADVKLVWTSLSHAQAGFYTAPEQVLGRVSSRQLAAGTILLPSHLRQANAVSRGQQVSLIARAGGVIIRARGEAQADAPLLGRIRVKNLSSGRIVEGQVIENGVVEIQG